MRHTERQAKVTYDRRSKRRRMQAGIEFSNAAFENIVDGYGEHQVFENGSFVAISEPNMERESDVRIGRVYGRLNGNTYMLLSYQKCKANEDYQLNPKAGIWQVNGENMIKCPIQIKTVKGQQSYRLRITLKSLLQRFNGLKNT